MRFPATACCPRSAARTLAALALSAMPLQAGVVFSESFESPVVLGLDDNTVPDNGKWIGSSVGFGATDRGLYNEMIAWPATPPFTTPFGKQAYFLNYANSALTTAVGATGQTLTAGVDYTVSFNTAVAVGTASGVYKVELVAFTTKEDDRTRKDANRATPGTVLATATGTVTTTDMSQSAHVTFTPDASNPNLGEDLGIRIIKDSGSVLYDNVRLIIGHDMNPSPADGEDLDAAGNVTLSWTNMPPTGSDTCVDVWFGSTSGSLDQQLVDGQTTGSTTAKASAAGTWYWRVDSYPDGNPNGTPVVGQEFSFTIADTDGDGLPDDYELAQTTPPSNTALDPASDLDNDELTAAREYIHGTDPNDADSDDDSLLDGPELTGVGRRPATSPVNPDSDSDGLSDGVESNTGKWVGAADTGTNPVDPDCDDDGIKDGTETNTRVLVSRKDTGTNPFASDTDNDGAGDYYEVNASYTDPFSAADKPPVPYPLPDPDGSGGATDKPVKVYIMAGQSNMVGIGYVSGIDKPGSLEAITKIDHKFPNFIDASNNWTQRQDVIYKGVVTATQNPGPLSANQGGGANRVGVELGFGHVMGYYHDEPVLLLKASQGNRSLAWDFCPPNATGDWEFTDGKTYPGYGGSPDKWPTGSTPAPFWVWYAGKQYDDCFRDESKMGVKSVWALGASFTKGWLAKHNNALYQCMATHVADASTEPGVGTGWSSVWSRYMIENAADVLANFNTLYPQWAAQGYEIAGFVWWQGHKDGGEDKTGTAGAYASRYEENLVHLINSLRSDFNAPNAPFVVAGIGFNGGQWNPGSSGDIIHRAQMAVGDPTKHPEFAGTVKSVETTGYWRELEESPGKQSFHYNNNAETYTLVGDAMARAMIELHASKARPLPPR